MSKTWLVTGSSRGFGLAIATAALAAGDSVVATGRDPEQLRGLETSFGSRVRRVALDVTDVEAAKHAVEVAVREFGSLDVVVNNAGYGISSSIEDMTDADFRNQLEVNLFGIVNVTKAALPVLRRQRSGHFLQFSSIGGRGRGTPGMSAYQTAKYAVEGFSEALSAEVKPLGINVTIIEPGPFRTEWGTTSFIQRPVTPDYEATVGAMNRRRDEAVASWPGDPAKAADVIVAMTNHSDPPLRLLLGAVAVEVAAQVDAERAREAASWEHVSRSVDFED